MRDSILRTLAFSVLVLQLLPMSALCPAPASDTHTGVLFHRKLAWSARFQAEQFVQKRFHQCGDDYFRKEYLELSVDDQHTYVYQYKNLEWTLVPQPVSEVDKLNGTDWRAEIVVKASAVRSTSDLNESHPGWLMWGADYKVTFTQERRGEIWHTDDNLNGYLTVPLSCSEIEQLLATLKTR